MELAVTMDGSLGEEASSVAAPSRRRRRKYSTRAVPRSSASAIADPASPAPIAGSRYVNTIVCLPAVTGIPCRK
jgi:hypothetical protein